MLSFTISIERQIFNSLYSQGHRGASINRDNEAPEFGYMVGGFVPGLSYPNLQSVKDIEVMRWINKHLDKFMANPLLFFGIWKDPKTGVVYFDLSECYLHESSAIDAATERGELAIYDVMNGTDIEL